MSDFPEKENLNNELPADNAEEFSTVFSDPTEHKKAAVKTKRRLLPKIIASVLAVAVLAGGTVAVIKLIPEREDDTKAPSIETIKVLELDSDDFKTVTVKNKNGSFKFYPKAETADSDSSDTSSSEPTVNWYLEGYGEDVVDTYSIGTIVGYAASLEAVREITTKSAADCGLENPEISAAVVQNDGKEFSLLVGNTSPDNTGTYVKLSTDDKIYITEGTIAENLTFDALSLAETGAIPAVSAEGDYADDSGVLATFDSITISGTKYPEKIVIVPNSDSELSEYVAYLTLSPTKRIADNIDGVFNFFKSGVAAEGAYSFDVSASARKKLGLDKPDISVELKAGSLTKTYSFKLQDDGAYAVWYDGAKLIKKIAATALTFAELKTTDYYADWVILQSINDLSNFTVKTTDKTYSFDIVYNSAEDAEETYVITHNGKKIVAQNFQDFYQGFVSLSCSEFTIDKVEGEPYVTVVLTYSDKERKASVVEFRKASETKYQYRIDGIDMGKVNSSELNKMLRNIEKVSNGKTVN